ncbi:MAG: hypothetical protein J0I98_14215 [Mesorhizobium sp.]|nr:hypothetical protein [Mesorhizobium sp.]MBN9243942.1 hypothetical protein [Mesorhizobium sp.]
MWFRFEKDFDFSPAERGGRVTIAYKGGMVVNVTRACAEAAEKAGAGSPTTSEQEVADGDADRSR